MNSLQQLHEVRLRGLLALAPPTFRGVPTGAGVASAATPRLNARPGPSDEMQAESAKADFVWLLLRFQPPRLQPRFSRPARG